MPNRTPWLDEPDTSSSVSRQHYIDAGRYLTRAESAAALGYLRDDCAEDGCRREVVGEVWARGLMWEVCAEHGPAVAAHEGGRFVPYLGDLSATSDDARDTI